MEGTEIVVFRRGGAAHATAPRCPHAGGNLAAGDIEEWSGESCLRCPRHGFVFRLSDGVSVSPQGTYTLGVFPCWVEGEVEIETEGEGADNDQGTGLGASSTDVPWGSCGSGSIAVRRGLSKEDAAAEWRESVRGVLRERRLQPMIGRVWVGLPAVPKTAFDDDDF